MSAAAIVQVQPAFPLLLVGSDDQAHSSLRQILQEDCRVYCASDRNDAIRVTEELDPWVVICDQILADGDWRDLLKDFQKAQHAPPLIVSSRLPDDRLWAEVLNLGGYDLLAKPFAAAEVSRVVKMAARRRTGRDRQ